MPSQDADRHDKIPHAVTLKTRRTAHDYTARFHRAMSKFWQRSDAPHAARLVQVHQKKAASNELSAQEISRKLAEL